MKKNLLIIVLLFFAWAQSLAINTTTNLNPFAYNLSAVLSNDQTTLTVKYCLNANVESLEIVFLKGEEVVKRFPVTDAAKRTKTTADDPYLAASSHSVDVQINDLGTGMFTWRIEVKGAGRNAVERYNQIYSFYFPTSIDIVKDPTSFNYGKVIVVESSHSGLNNASYHSSSTGAGLYVFNPDFTYRKNRQGDPGFNGGSATWGDISNQYFVNTKYAPRRVRVSEDGRIFVSSMYEQGSTLHKYQKGIVLWEVDAYFSKWNTVMGHGVGGAKYDISAIVSSGVTYYKNQLLTSGGKFIAAPNAGLDVRGRGENLKLLLLSCDYRAFANNHQGFMCCEYNLGTNTTWSTTPSKDFVVNDHVFATSTNSNVQYDKDGGIWCISNRGEPSTNQPALVHKTSSVTEDYRNTTRANSRNAGFRFNGDFTKVIMATTGQIGRVYDYYSVKQNGNYFSATFTDIDMSAVGTYINDFVWDNANNIYAVGNNNGVTSGGDGHVALYCLPYKNTDVFTTSAPKPFTISNTVVWHPYHCDGDVSNEDLWELFMEDWNQWYANSETTPITVKKAEQPITGAFGFTLPADKDADGDMTYPGGLAMDFMTNENSPWKWLGDYIQPIANPHTIPALNEELWTAFKTYFNETYYNSQDKYFNQNNKYPRSAETTMANAAVFWPSGIDNDDVNIMTDPNSNFKWLGDYIKSISEAKGIVIDSELKWRGSVRAFFNANALPLGNFTPADFSSAGQPSAWKPYYVDSDGNVSLSTDLEWRKQIYAFFNQTNEVGYNKAGVGWVREATGDFTKKGQPKPDGDPAAGWYNAWWNATFPVELHNGDKMPKIKRKGYVLAGWYYGTAEGYYMSERVGDSGYDNNQTYKAHLWAKWYELCLYEGYIAKDIHSLEENDKVNNNLDMLFCANTSVTKQSYKMSIERKFLADGVSYSTLVLPFAIPRTTTNNVAHYIKQITDENGIYVFDTDKGGEMPSILVCQGARKTSVNGEDMVELVFEELDVTSTSTSNTESAIPPYVPFLIKPAKPLTSRLQLWAASVYHRENISPAVLTGVQLQPVLAPTVIQATVDCPLILVDQNRLAQVYHDGEMLGLRGYFILEPELRNLPMKISVRENLPTNVEGVSDAEMKVEKFIRDNRVYILRDGKVYDMMGNLVK